GERRATEARANAIRTELDLLDAAVPDEVQLPDLIRTLNDTADQSGVDFMSIAPAQPTSVLSTGSTVQSAPVTGSTPTESPSSSPSPSPSASPAESSLGTLGGPSLPTGISVVPSTVIIEGSYFAVDEYLFRLETLPRISKVTTFTLAPGSSGYPQLQLTIQVNFYSTDVSAG